MTKNKADKTYMDVANIIGQRSYSNRNKVGALLVKEDNILAYGYNGTPRGWPNNCEDHVIIDDAPNLVTRPEVLHAESNAIAKVARTTSSSEGSTLYVTLSPCYDCAKMIHQAGVVRVVYSEEYRHTDGIEFLKKCGIECVKFAQNI